MAVIKPCPRCQNPLEIPQPPPDQIRCDKCGAVIKNRASHSDKQEVPAAAPALAPLPNGEPAATYSQTVAIPAATRASDTPRFTAIILGVLGGLLLICVLPVAGLGLAWFFSSAKTPEEKRQPLQEQVKPEVTAKPKEPNEVPMPPKIRAAIDRGAAHLKKRLQEKWDVEPPSDQEIGARALGGLALLEAKVPPRDPALQKTIADVRAGGPRLQLIYALGTAIFFLNRLHDVEPLIDSDRELLRSMALRMVAGQLEDGRWTYQNPPISAEAQKDLLQQLSNDAYKPGRQGGGGSNSMTQFALLALWGSRRHDLPLRAVLMAPAEHFRKTQWPNGSWDYDADQDRRCFDSNTCAGLMALAMEKTLLEEGIPGQKRASEPPNSTASDEQCAKAFVHLSKLIGRTNKDAAQDPRYAEGIINVNAGGDYYFLWCLERVAVIYDKSEIEGKDWYRWGSETILKHQTDSGAWTGNYGDISTTSFAILFLTRANLAKDLTESIRMRSGK